MEEYSIVGLAIALITAIGYGLRTGFTWFKSEMWPTFKGWGTGFYESTIQTQQELQKASAATNAFVAKIQDSQGAINAAWMAHCQFLREDVKQRKDIDEDQRDALLSHIDKIEQGLTE